MKINFSLRFLKHPQSFFLENRGLRQTVFKNTFWLTLAEGITRLLKLALIIYIARILGATEYGKFTFALAFVSIFAFLANFGTNEILTREFAKDREKEKDFYALFSLRILLSLLALAGTIGLSFLITPSSLIRRLIWVLALMIFSHVLASLFFAFLRARQKMQYEAWVRIFEALVVTGLGFFILFKLPSVLALSWAYFLAAFLALCFVLFFFHRKILPLSLSFNRKIWKNYLHLSWPLAFITVFAVIYNQIDSVMMGHWGMITETGWYNAAYKIIDGVVIPSALIAQAFFPALTFTLIKAKKRFQEIWSSYLQTIIFISLLLVGAGLVLAPRIIDFVYGPSFSPSILAFQILILMAGLLYFNQAFARMLIITNHQKKIFWVTLSAALLNIFLNFLFIPHFSLYGAAFATFLTFLFIFFLLLRLVVRLIRVPLFDLRVLLTLLGSAISCLAMAFVISLSSVWGLNLFLLIIISIASYLCCFLIWRKVIRRFAERGPSPLQR